MARDVHDTLAQGLTGIVLNLEAAEEAATDLPEAVRNCIRRARDVARENLKEARRSVLALSSSLPVSDDLATSIRGLGGPLPLEHKDSLGIFHPRNEQATDNALQHARASSIRIELVLDEKQIQLKITDDGRGFELKNAGLGFGLTGMRERAEEIGGKCDLTSQPGKGTRVEVRVPLRSAARGQLPNGEKVQASPQQRDPNRCRG